MQVATGNDCRIVTFPGISTGVYRFPKDAAAEIAVRSVYKFLSHDSRIDKVIFVCFDNEYYDFISGEIKKLME